MFNHEPPDYACPFCKLIAGVEDDINKKKYIVYEDENTLAYVSPKWWGTSLGNVLVVPKKHIENIYDIPDEILGDIYKTVKKVALAIRKSYPSEGTSTRQHNEPAGGQDVWHLHVHVFPRYEGDNLYKSDIHSGWAPEDKRLEFANKLKNYFKDL